MLQMSIEAALARRDWPVFMEGLAAVCVITGRGTAGEWGMEAFGFRRPLGMSIMAWILSSVGNKNTEKIFSLQEFGWLFCSFCVCLYQLSFNFPALLYFIFLFCPWEENLQFSYTESQFTAKRFYFKDCLLFQEQGPHHQFGKPSIWCMMAR